MEVGGRWSHESAKFIALLAKAKARSCPQLLRQAAIHGYIYRWSGLLAVSAQRAFAASLLELRPDAIDHLDGGCPDFSEVAVDMRYTDDPIPSRLA